MAENTTISCLQKILRDFVNERDWNQFHNPKNLVMAMTGELGELAEHFQWLTPEESIAIVQNQKVKQEISYELADVFSYLLRLADVLEVDLAESLVEKIEKNRAKYPINKSKGRSTKYNKL